MSNATEPGEARATLAEIQKRHGQVIEGSLVPGWYWWAVAVPMVGLGFLVDTGSPVAIAAAAIAFGIGVALLTGWVIVGGLHGVKVQEALLGPRGAGLIVGFIWLLVGGTIAMAFVLRAAGVTYPATIATLAGAVGLVVGGPWLMHQLHLIMLRQVDRR